LWHDAARIPFNVIWICYAELFHRERRWNLPPSAALGQLDKRLRHTWRAHVRETLPIPQNESIEVNQPCNAISGSVRNTSDYGASVTMPNQNNVAQVLVVKYGQYILNMSQEPDLWRRQMGTITEPGQGRSEDLSATFSECPRQP